MQSALLHHNLLEEQDADDDGAREKAAEGSLLLSAFLIIFFMGLFSTYIHFLRIIFFYYPLPFGPLIGGNQYPSILFFTFSSFVVSFLFFFSLSFPAHRHTARSVPISHETTQSGHRRLSGCCGISSETDGHGFQEIS